MIALAQRARHGDVAERAAVAAGATTPPELLTWLANDPAPAVRAAVAANLATPPQAGLLLAEDADPAVRSALARRVGAASPKAASEPGRRGRIVNAILARLVEDAAVEVRAALADAVAGLPDAPRELILRLARDTALRVAEPVLRLSPLLTEADLIALVARPPAGFTRRAVAARQHLGEAVSDAVAGSADRQAIGVLLANPSAAIREATLDRLAAGAAAEPGWQAALVRRPRLPARAAHALGAILAAHLLEVLAARPDLPGGLAETLRERVEARFAAAAPSEAAAREAAEAHDRPALLALLAAAAGCSALRIEAALALRSPRVIAALCWRAGWNAETAERVQAALGTPPPRILRPNVEGGWTLSPAEMQWQLELLDELPG